MSPEPSGSFVQNPDVRPAFAAPSGLKLAEAQEPLPEELLARGPLPIDFVEAALSDRVRDMVLIRELLLFIPFVVLFLVVSVNVVDVPRTHFAVGALKDLTLDHIFPSIAQQNASIWETLERGEQVIYDPDPKWPDLAEQPNWHAWTGYAVRRLFNCAPDQLVAHSASEANVEGHRSFVPDAAPTAAPDTGVNGSTATGGNRTVGTNATASNGTASGGGLSGNAGTAPAAGLVGVGERYGITGNMSELEARGWLPKPLIGQIIPVGALRLRAQLVKNDSCTVPDHANRPDATEIGPNRSYTAPGTCYANTVSTDTELRVSPRCYKTNPLDPDGYPMFAYRQCGLVGGVPTSTELNVFHCGGYTYDIPFNLTCTDALRVLYQILDPSCPFVDPQATRFFALEYFAYAPSVDAFISVKHIVEVTSGGAWIPSEQFRAFAVVDGSRTFVIVLDFFFLVFVSYYIAKFFLDWRKFYRAEGRALRYLLNLWTLLELINVTTYLAVFILRWMWWGYSVQLNAEIPQSQYPEDMERLLFTFSSMRYAMAVNFILTFMKMLKFLKISDRLAIVGITFEKAQSDVLGLLAIFTIVMLGFSVAGNVLFGSQMAEFAALDRCFSTLMFMLLGELDYASMKEVNPSLAGIYFWAFLIIGFFLVLNFIVAVVSDAFTAAGEEQFVAPLAESIVGTFSDIAWALSPTILCLRLSLWRKRRTQYALEKQMLGIVVQRHAMMKLKATDSDNRVTAAEVFGWFPPKLRRDGRVFFVRFWGGFVHEHGLKMDTDEEQTRQERRGAVSKGTRLGLRGLTPEVAREMTVQLDRLNKLGDFVVAQLQEHYGAGGGVGGNISSPPTGLPGRQDTTAAEIR